MIIFYCSDRLKLNFIAILNIKFEISKRVLQCHSYNFLTNQLKVTE